MPYVYGTYAGLLFADPDWQSGTDGMLAPHIELVRHVVITLVWRPLCAVAYLVERPSLTAGLVLMLSIAWQRKAGQPWAASWAQSLCRALRCAVPR